MSETIRPLNQTIDLKGQEKQILKELEKLFGRIPYVLGNSYTGFTFTDQAYPELHPIQPGVYQAWITKDCQSRRLKGTWQLAHELAHLVAPATLALDTYFEEGMVMSLQLRYMERFMKWREGRDYVEASRAQWRMGDTAKYGRALDDVCELETQCGRDVVVLAKELIEQHSVRSFGLLTLDQFQSTTGIESIVLLERLLERFPPFKLSGQPPVDSASSSGDEQ